MYNSNNPVSENYSEVDRNELLSLVDKSISLQELKDYLKKEKQEFLRSLIPIYSSADLTKINRKYINKKVVNDLYTKSKEFEQKFLYKIQKYEMSVTERECKQSPSNYENKKPEQIKVSKPDFLKRFYNIYSSEGKSNSFYKLEYSFDDLISLDEKWAKLSKEVSKVLFTGQTLEYVVTDDNITECAFFQDPPNIRYWAFRFHLFHNLRTYLNSTGSSNLGSPFYFEQDERATIINEMLKQNAEKALENEQSESEEGNEDFRNEDAMVDGEDPEDKMFVDENGSLEPENSFAGIQETQTLASTVQNKSLLGDEKENNPDDDYYSGSDDSILLKNEYILLKNLNKHKDNNVIKNAILNDFKPIYLTNELWFSVTPEDISMFIADYCYKKMSNNGATKLRGIAMDITGGSGLDSISLSRYWPKVIAIDINMENLYSGFKNAQNYNCQDKLSFIHNDFTDPVFFNLFKKIYKGKIDLIYSSPPWSGPSYGELKLYDVDEHLGMGGLSSLLRKTLQLTNNCCFFLPKNSSVNQIMTIARFHFQKTKPPVKIIYVSLRGKTKAALVLFGKKLASDD